MEPMRGRMAGREREADTLIGSMAGLILLALGLAWGGPVAAGTSDRELAPALDDRPLAAPLEHPDWFKRSFLDLRADLAEAVRADKAGLIVYFHQAHCPYCEALLSVNFGNPDILAYTRRHFDLVPVDIWGIETVTDVQGRVLDERGLALREDTNFTPSMLFYDRDGRLALRLRGYYPPYRFRAALKYVVEGYYRQESFAAYLQRADPPPKFDLGDLNDEDFFASPPYALDRRSFPADRPLVVFFEQGDCHACDILHSGPLQAEDVQAAMLGIEAVQLDMWSATPVLTPDGHRETARQWAGRLGLHYAPALVFFDERGREIIRIDSVVGLYRLRNILSYVVSGAYREYPDYLRWRAVDSGRARP